MSRDQNRVYPLRRPRVSARRDRVRLVSREAGSPQHSVRAICIGAIRESVHQRPAIGADCPLSLFTYSPRFASIGAIFSPFRRTEILIIRRLSRHQDLRFWQPGRPFLPGNAKLRSQPRLLIRGMLPLRKPFEATLPARTARRLGALAPRSAPHLVPLVASGVTQFQESRVTGGAVRDVIPRALLVRFVLSLYGVRVRREVANFASWPGQPCLSGFG